ncbi:redoxin domain-containing protein [Stieleria varia]|uniref:redoxin domain-containing protein n=1 Tax=Stieleria varia TaxID=2528005 RepID=UPI001E33F549|nr:redoxin domain-containing protein [Stieleria varia]
MATAPQLDAADATSSAQASSAQAVVPFQQMTLRGTDGKDITLPPSKFTVVCFLGTQCPLAKLYGGRLQDLSDRYADRGVNFVGVNSNVQDSPAEIDAYAREHRVHFPMVKDADQSIADALKATRTPEVFVLDALGIVRYQGRIDDQYEPGRARAEPSRNDLDDAIAALLAGEPVKNPETAGVGCLITRVKRPEDNEPSKVTVTFNRDIAPILNTHCVECHRPGEIGPMELTDYDEVIGWGQMILEVIDEKRMPPWHADPAVGHYEGERIMPRADRDTIAKWIDEGMAEGDAADLPPQQHFASGWHLETKPDAELPMRDRPFLVPSEGIIEYQYFVVDPGWKTDQWIQAAQVIPGDASVVHHCIVFVRPPDGSLFNGIGWLGAYVPGQRTFALPPGHARRIPAGSKLVFQMHYTPNGRETNDQSRVGVWRIPESEVTHEVTTQIAINHEFEIPPENGDFEVKMTKDSFYAGGRMLGITPHMHLRGKSFRLDATWKDGKTETMLSVPHYDFNWQHWYAFRKPVDLDAIQSLEMTVTFDNSRGNPVNPAPEEYVSWGDQTHEEMAIAFFDVATPVGAIENNFLKGVDLSDADEQRIKDLTQQFADQFRKQMDRDGDGTIAKEETPQGFQRYMFRHMDENGDQVLDAAEIESVAHDRAVNTVLK